MDEWTGDEMNEWVDGWAGVWRMDGEMGRYINELVDS